MRLAITTALLLSVGTAHARTWYVDDNAPCDILAGSCVIGCLGENGSSLKPFDSIQEALDAASDGDTIIVRRGTYTGTCGNLNLDFHGKTLSLEGAGCGVDGSTIDCAGLGRAFYFDGSESPDVRISGFRILNGQAEDGGAVYFENGSPTFVDCCFDVNEASDNGGAAYVDFLSKPTFIRCFFLANESGVDGGAIFSRGGDLLVTDCNFQQNEAGAKGGAIMLMSNADCEFERSTFLNNVATDGGAMNIDLDSDVMMTDGTLQFNLASERGGAIYIDRNSSLELTSSPEPTTTGPSTVIGNMSGSGGGGIYVKKSTLTANSAILNRNTSGNNGGAINVQEESTATLSRCNIDDNTAGPRGRGGGIHLLNASSLGVTECSLDGNTAGLGGGAVFVQGSTVNLSDSGFEKNQAGTQGGALRIRGGAVGMISGCDFIENDSTGDGGAISASGGDTNLDVEGLGGALSTFMRNKSGAAGGAISCYEGASLTVADSDFAANRAATSGGTIYSLAAGAPLVVRDSIIGAGRALDGHGGGIFCSAVPATVERVTFDGNNATLNGGGISMGQGFPLVVVDSLFQNNEAINGRGGGIHHFGFDGVATRVTGSSFDSCVAKLSGGGIANEHGDVKIQDTDFQSCRSNTDSGGALIAVMGDLSVTGGEFRENRARWRGGAIFTDGGAATLSDARFERNVVDNLGGGVSVESGSLMLAGCEFVANEADFGGGLETEFASVAADGCVFQANTARGGGGAAHRGDSTAMPHIHYKWSTFEGNSTRRPLAGGPGGGILAEYVTLLVHNSGFYGNEANDDGGGISTRLARLELVNSAMSCNVAELVGGGVALQAGTEGILVNTTFSRNRTIEPASVGGGISANGLSAQVYNSIFYENIDSSGNTHDAQVAHVSGTLALDDNVFTPVACPVPLGTNTCADPMLVDPDGADDVCGTADDDVSIAASSPAIDAGRDFWLPADVLDIDDDTDVTEITPLDLAGSDRFIGTVDAGAYEVGEADSCRADFDGDGELTLFDFLAFLNAFDAGDPAADFDGDGELTFFDLLVFQNEFDFGCP